MQRSILVTEFQGDADVMIFTSTLTPKEVEARLKKKGDSYGEVYEVPEADRQYYCFEPCFFD